MSKRNISDCIKWQQTNHYTPQSISVFVCEKKLNIDDTMIQQWLHCGQLEKAEIEIKRIYRKLQKRERQFVYYFKTEDGLQNLFVNSPFMLMNSKDSLLDRFKRYKELKSIFAENEWQYHRATSVTLGAGYKVENQRKDFVRIDKRVYIGFPKYC